MTSLAIPSSPSSFQLRLGFRSRKCGSSLLWMNFRPTIPCRIRTFYAAENTPKDGGEGQKTFEGNSWMNSGAAADTFSGWLDKDSDDSHRMGKFGGFVGAGLAVVFIAAGVAFASISLRQRGNSGLKSQLEPPLTSQQEEFTLDDKDESGNHHGDEYKAVWSDGDLENDSIPESKTGIDQESLPPREMIEEPATETGPDVKNNEAALESGLCDDINVDPSSLPEIFESNLNTIAPISITSSQEGLQSCPSVDNTLVPTHPNMISPELPRSDIIDFSDSPDLVIELEENPGVAEPDHLPKFDVDSTHVNLNHPEGMFVSTKLEHSEIPSESSRDSVGQIINHPLTLDGSLTSESDVTLDPPVEFKDIVETVDSASSVQEFKLSETLTVLSDGIHLPPEGKNLNENGSCEPTTVSVPVVGDVYSNELNVIGDNENDRSRSFLESEIPENTFSYAGIPAPSLLSAALQVPPGKVVVPAVVDQVQGQALAALQVLKVIETDVKAGDLCTRRDYARWLVSASSVLSRNTISKVYPAMYIENITELAFDDVMPEDPDFPSIQGLAEAGLISSRLSSCDDTVSSSEDQGPVLFSPESPLSRQDLVSWKKALEKRHLPEVDKKILYQCSGFLDIDKINQDAWPALVADMSAGEHGITALAFGYTRLFQPDKPVTKAQAAIALATGEATEIVAEELARIEAESVAETAVAAHTALVAQVEKDVNANFEKELTMEREKRDAMEKLAEEINQELKRLRAETEEENNTLVRARAAVESEMEIFLRLRHEVEEQLESLLSNKTEISFERERINKLRKDAESENLVISQLQYELEVERKALSMARAWAEDEAKRAREQAKALEEARDRWERQGLKVVVEGELREDAIAGVTWAQAREQVPVEEIINKNKTTITHAENLVNKLKAMAGKMKQKSTVIIEQLIQKVQVIISILKKRTAEATTKAREIQNVVVSKVGRTADEFHQNIDGFGSSVKDGAKRVAGDFRVGVEKITQKFKA